MNVKNFLREFWRDENGIETIEWALLASLVAIAGIVAWGALGTKVSGVADKVKDSLVT